MPAIFANRENERQANHRRFQSVALRSHLPKLFAMYSRSRHVRNRMAQEKRATSRRTLMALSSPSTESVLIAASAILGRRFNKVKCPNSSRGESGRLRTFYVILLPIIAVVGDCVGWLNWVFSARPRRRDRTRRMWPAPGLRRLPPLRRFGFFRVQRRQSHRPKRRISCGRSWPSLTLLLV